MRLLAFGLVLLGFLQSYASRDPQAIALYEMKIMLNDSRDVLKDWRDNQVSPCYFPGVNCQDNEVTEITLSSSGLSGVLSPSIAKLTTLKHLSLDGNSITGGIPQELGNLSSLTTLRLGRNRLNGSIPESFGRLSELQNLDLSQNLLSGNIPSSLSNLPSLNDINLAYNNLSGEIPEQLLQVSQYNYMGNHFNCGQHLISCEGGTTEADVANRGKLRIGTSIGIALPIIGASFAIASVFFYIWRRRQARESSVPCSINQEDIQIMDSLILNLSTLQTATNNFDECNKLGEGGFGVVYKGALPNGQVIAVKRLSHSSQQGIGELKNELVLVGRLQHKNLVRLVGVCLENEEKLLVYEYMPNRSLDTILFDPDKSKVLNWEKRFKIISEIARGLQYLHEESRLKIIHRDLKASNILLDSDLTPKISDFGLAKLFGGDQSHVVTNRVAGTYGYMAPEYAMCGQYSVKSDVFSFGVLVLEIVTGRRSIGSYNYEQSVSLLGLIWQHWTMGTVLELVDPSLSSSSSSRGGSQSSLQREQMLRCVHIGLLCVQENPADRPMLSAIAVMLSSCTTVLQAPSKPAFFVHSGDAPCGAGKSTAASPKHVSVTEIEPR